MPQLDGLEYYSESFWLTLGIIVGMVIYEYEILDDIIELYRYRIEFIDKQLQMRELIGFEKRLLDINNIKCLLLIYIIEILYQEKIYILYRRRIKKMRGLLAEMLRMKDAQYLIRNKVILKELQEAIYTNVEFVQYVKNLKLLLKTRNINKKQNKN